MAKPFRKPDASSGGARSREEAKAKDAEKPVEDEARKHALAIWAKQRHPSLRIRGLDGDAAIIEQARRNVRRNAGQIRTTPGIESGRGITGNARARR